MDGTNPAAKGTKYSTTAKVFHWGFVVLFAYGIAKQVDDISQLEDFALLRFELIFATILILLLGASFPNTLAGTIEGNPTIAAVPKTVFPINFLLFMSRLVFIYCYF